MAAIRATSRGVHEAFDKALMDTRPLWPVCAGKIDEHQTIRAPLSISPLFTTLAANALVLSISRRLIGDYIILNQQTESSIRPMPNDTIKMLSTAIFPIAFCLQPPAGIECPMPRSLCNTEWRDIRYSASHKTERLPSAEAAAHRIQVTAPANHSSFGCNDVSLRGRQPYLHTTARCEPSLFHPFAAPAGVIYRVSSARISRKTPCFAGFGL